jgi:hypothetical protein
MDPPSQFVPPSLKTPPSRPTVGRVSCRFSPFFRARSSSSSFPRSFPRVPHPRFPSFPFSPFPSLLSPLSNFTSVNSLCSRSRPTIDYSVGVYLRALRNRSN